MLAGSPIRRRMMMIWSPRGSRWRTGWWGSHPHDTMTNMDIQVEDVLERYGREIATLTKRVVFAEARAETAEKKLKEIDNDND